MPKKPAPRKRDRSKPGLAAKAAAKAAKAPKVPRIPRQPSLPTMEVPHNKEIENAGVQADEAKLERMRLTEVETKRNDKLIAVMRKHGVKTYVNRIGSDV